MSCAHRLGHPFDGVTIGDVADLDLRVSDLVCEGSKPFLATCDEDAAPVVLRERPGNRCAEPARSAGDDGDAFDYLQTRIARVDDGRFPCLSAARALRR